MIFGPKKLFTYLLGSKLLWRLYLFHFISLLRLLSLLLLDGLLWLLCLFRLLWLLWLLIIFDLFNLGIFFGVVFFLPLFKIFPNYWSVLCSLVLNVFVNFLFCNMRLYFKHHFPNCYFLFSLFLMRIWHFLHGFIFRLWKFPLNLCLWMFSLLYSLLWRRLDSFLTLHFFLGLSCCGAFLHVYRNFIISNWLMNRKYDFL